MVFDPACPVNGRPAHYFANQLKLLMPDLDITRSGIGAQGESPATAHGCVP